MTAVPVRPAPIIETLLTALGGHRHRGADERQIQDSIAQLLKHLEIRFDREHPLSALDRPDFFVAASVVIEVKMKAPRTSVLMQLGRYATHEQVSALILASPRFTVVTGLPERIHHKPLYGVALPGVGLA